MAFIKNTDSRKRKICLFSIGYVRNWRNMTFSEGLQLFSEIIETTAENGVFR